MPSSAMKIQIFVEEKTRESEEKPSNNLNSRAGLLLHPTKAREEF
jgi:hypothetical protein